MIELSKFDPVRRRRNRCENPHLIVTVPTAKQARARALMLAGFDVPEIALLLECRPSTVIGQIRICCQKRIEASYRRSAI